MQNNAEVTQLVEFQPSKLTVAGSIPVFRSIWIDSSMVEQEPLKLKVEGSSPSQSTILLNIIGKVNADNFNCNKFINHNRSNTLKI